MPFHYFDTHHAIQVHDTIIQKSGGLIGMINQGLLESILAHIRNDDYYPTLEDKATHLLFSVNKNHSFKDGNKRSSLALTAYFIEINGFDFRVGRFIREMENITVDVADNRIDKALLGEIVKSLLYEREFTNELKIKILQAKDSGHIWE